MGVCGAISGPQMSSVWSISEPASLSQPAEGRSIWINEQVGAEHKYHRHLAIGTEDQVIHQIQNCLEWLMQSWNKEDPQLMGGGEGCQSRKNKCVAYVTLSSTTMVFFFSICWRLRECLHFFITEAIWHAGQEHAVWTDCLNLSYLFWKMGIYSGSLNGLLWGLNELTQ